MQGYPSLDGQGKGIGKEEIHERIVHLKNQSDKTINLLFAESTCRCSVAELPGDTILPGEKLPMKCTLSTTGRVSDRAGGEIWIAFRFAAAKQQREARFSHVCSSPIDRHCRCRGYIE